MICRYSFTTGSFAHLTWVGSLTKAIEVEPAVVAGVVLAVAICMIVGSIETELT